MLNHDAHIRLRCTSDKSWEVAVMLVPLLGRIADRLPQQESTSILLEPGAQSRPVADQRLVRDLDFVPTRNEWFGHPGHPAEMSLTIPWILFRIVFMDGQR
jgi:hypothetical protein